ncbi:hypothetical protein CMV30_11640 [Nibricoccus aquaticus]|uniref:Ig-like domain-containing protein n=1 Tax=Nibricoccus aquaticus TaxID=2576891 RepID=A0A290Q7Z3_9BACT|nr:immunoglobulin domain-containing protein [Nibricoccus aquaticus]ATC64553.1 hypothetical protein CMV30_11640 [Nibricoccus aquaticus]
MNTLKLTRFMAKSVRALLASFVCTAFAVSTSAAITFDAVASKAATNGSNTSWSHTTGSGTDRILIVGLATEDTSTSVLNVSAITYGGVALTAVANSTATAGSSTYDRTQLFYLLNPASGTNTISVTWGGAVNGISAGSTSLAGVTQSAPSVAAINSTTSGNTISANIAVATAGSWLVSVANSGASNATLTAGSTQIKRWGLGQSNSGGAGSTASPATGTVSTSWTASSSSQLALSVAVLTPSSGGTTVVAPAITTQPSSQTVTTGASATLSVAASGTAPLSYQWRFNGSAISGATSASYTLSNAQSANAGSYSVVVSNSAGSATSNNATLTISSTATAPSITTQPASQTINVGGSATFSVTASGTATLTYQWRFNGSNISGATGSSYSLSNAQTAAAGNYSVVVTNSVGTATSNNAVLTVNTGSTAGVIYVSPTGTDANPGTISAPTTLTAAIAEAVPGDTIYLRGGTYNLSATVAIAFGNNGTSANPKRIFAYQSEVPVLNFSAQATGDANRGIHLFGNYWHFRGVTIQGAGDNGMLIGGNNNTIELCTFKNNRDSGLQISRRASTLANIADWPSNNLILNCTAFDNADPGAENADGFACKLTSGPGNVFRGCIAHNNIDDGWDLYANTDTGAIGTVLIENCIAYNNGVLTNGGTSGSGDKNGFKLGGSGVDVAHTIRRCIAFGNGQHGFTDNNNQGAMTVLNNTSFNNTETNFNWRTGSTATFTNNASYNSGQSDTTNGTLTGTTNLFWKNNVSNNNGGTKVISAADFQTLTPPSGGFTRNSDGSINLGNFAKLVSGSDLVNGGTPSGTDIGAVESF